MSNKSRWQIRESDCLQGETPHNPTPYMEDLLSPGSEISRLLQNILRHALRTSFPVLELLGDMKRFSEEIRAFVII